MVEVVSDLTLMSVGVGAWRRRRLKYDHEFYDDEDDYEGPDEMMRERSQTVTEEAVEQMDEIVELRRASQTRQAAARLQNLAAALKSLGG